MSLTLKQAKQEQDNIFQIVRETMDKDIYSDDLIWDYILSNFYYYNDNGRGSYEPRSAYDMEDYNKLEYASEQIAYIMGM